MENRQTQTASSKVFDREQALDAVGGDLDLLVELVGLFLEDCPRMVDELREAVGAGEADSLRRAAHTFKGSVSLFGAPQLMQLAGELERIGAGGDLGAAGETLARLEEELARLRADLSELRA